MRCNDDEAQRMVRAYESGLRAGRSVRAVLSFFGEHAGFVLLGAAVIGLLLGDGWRA